MRVRKQANGARVIAGCWAALLALSPAGHGQNPPAGPVPPVVTAPALPPEALAPPGPAAPFVVEPSPPIGTDFPLWLRPPGPAAEGGEAGGEGRPEGRGEGRSEVEIETDRDSFTPATTTAGRGRVITEAAYSFLDNRGVAETHSFPEMIVRYGVGERFELRLGWNYEVGGAGSEVSGSGSEGDTFVDRAGVEEESRLAYGFKARLTEQARWVPDSAVIVQATTPTSGAATDTHLITTSVFGWELPNRWKWDTGFRYGTASEEEDRFVVYAPSTVLKVPVGERWNLHAEYFGLFSQDKADDFVRHYFSPGAHFLVTPDFEIGTRVGWGLNDQSARFFVNAGLGWRY
jgi:hypothetical protein